MFDDLPADSRDSGNAIWTVYRHPKEFSEPWVLRVCEILKDKSGRRTNVLYLLNTLDEARAMVPPDKSNVGRFEQDDPVIFESWV
jgi:hypothetical protein